MQPAAPGAGDEPRAPILDPVDRVCELCFGLFMALTFVGGVSAAVGVQDAGRLMFYTALGCNLAWGLADGVMYLVRTITARARRLRIAGEVRGIGRAGGVALLRGELSGAMQVLVSDAELEAIRARLAALPTLPPKAHLEGPDYLAAGAIFLLVVLGTFPVALPFLVWQDSATALLVSRVLTLVMLFACGLALGRHGGGGGWKAGLAMTLVGVVLTAAIIALGG